MVIIFQVKIAYKAFRELFTIPGAQSLTFQNAKKDQQTKG